MILLRITFCLFNEGCSRRHTLLLIFRYFSCMAIVYNALRLQVEF